MNPRSLRFLVFLTLAFAFSISPVAPARADTVPVVVTSATGSGQVGQDFSDRITTADNNSTDFAAAGLPGGLAIDPVNGNVTGVPTTAGTYVVTISATNSAGTGTMQVTLIIVPAVPVVTLTATTPEVTVGSGGMAVFTVSLSEAAATDLYVNYTIKGSAANGTDYTLLSGDQEGQSRQGEQAH